MIKKIRKKIKTIIDKDEKDRFFSFESFMFIISVIYGGAVKLRKFCYENKILKSKELPCKVISIGNITAGGTGKTPMTIKTAQTLKNLGYKAVVVSRGYKGSAEKTGGIVSNGQKILMKPEEAGDEPFMMAANLKNIPVVVGAKRYRAGMLAIREFNPDVIVLDDAFQHIKLKRNVDIVLLDCSRPFGNTHFLPRGMLREPPSSLSRADALIITRFNSASDKIRQKTMDLIKNTAKGKPVFSSSHIPYVYKPVKFKDNSLNMDMKALTPDFLHKRRVIAFSGLAQNNNFRKTVENLNCDLINFLDFPDHHNYTEADLKTIIKTSIESKAEFIITTEKDYVRVMNKTSWPAELVVAGLKISFQDDETAFTDFIKTGLLS
jgi:tetraacyldisaccharide 4'-kinase